MIYKLDDVERIKIITKPGKPLGQWYTEQTDKPDVLLNASLYTFAPFDGIGTIIQNGELTHNNGKGFGFGIRKDGTWDFGGPFEDAGWRDYISGYYGLIQNGVVVDPPWMEAMFKTKANRIGIGRTDDGKLCIAEVQAKTIAEFASYARQNGVVDLANLDGGGSKHLIYKGIPVFASSRTPWNCIAIWLKKEEKTDEEEDVSVVAKCTKRIGTFDANGKAESGRYIDKNDICTIGKVTDNVLIEVEYPISKGTRKAYLKSLEHFTKM